MSFRGFPDEKIDQAVDRLTGGKCAKADTYYFKDSEGRYCACYQQKVKEQYANLSQKKSKKNIQDLDDLLKKTYSLMVEKSKLSQVDKERLLSQSPTPKVEFLANSDWQGYYSQSSEIPPFNPSLLIEPGMIELYNNPKYRDYILGTIAHELGHHFFTSLNEDSFFGDLTQKSKNTLRKFTDCIDNTTIEREILPGIRGDLVNPNCTHIKSKRAELGADFFSIQANSESTENLGRWDSIKGVAWMCNSKVMKLDKESRERMFQKSTHTEPISRAQITLNPPNCLKSLW